MINEQSYAVTLGFAIYSFEGIGIVMPVMHACETPEKFHKIFIAAIITLAIFMIAFGEICYFTYGSNLTEPIVTEMLPKRDGLVIFTKLSFIVVAITSYAIIIQPTFTITEGWILSSKCMPEKKTRTRYWLKNLIRFIIVASAAYISVALIAKVEKFLGLMGALFCSPLALTIPALVHMKLEAKTKSENFVNVILIIISIVILFFSTW